MEKINKITGDVKMIQDEEFIDNLIAVDFNNRSEESKYK
jgi:hypothetical protein